MSRPYGVMADLHCHNWSQFAGVNAAGVNTRLLDTLREINRCCEAVQEAGGKLVVIAGDIFHTRGSVAPSVFNPVKACFDHWTAQGMTFRAISGNHDLESKRSTKLSSAVTMLEGPGFEVFHSPAMIVDQDHTTTFVMIPWIPKPVEALEAMAKIGKQISGFDHGLTDAFIHAGIDGVLSGVPAHGFSADKLAELRFRRVFAGHYHHHADMGKGVVSVGAATHQTWGDVGTRAGWLLVSREETKWFASHAPNFIRIDGDEDPDELPLIVDGHFVHVRIGKATAAEVAKWREMLREMGARGVVVQSVPVSAPVRVGSIATGLLSLNDAVAKYCEEQSLAPAVIDRSQLVLAEVTR